LAKVSDELAQGPTVSVETALQEWLRAWSERRVDDYLDFYDPGYTPLGGIDRAVWAQRRRAAIRRPHWVNVRADQISTTEMSPEEVVVGFVQQYSASAGHRETTRKSMIWRWTDGRWRIVSEQSLTVPGKVDREEAEKAQLEAERAAARAAKDARRVAVAALAVRLAAVIAAELQRRQEEKGEGESRPAGATTVAAVAGKDAIERNEESARWSAPLEGGHTPQTSRQRCTAAIIGPRLRSRV
jgi:hypothetical protein